MTHIITACLFNNEKDIQKFTLHLMGHKKAEKRYQNIIGQDIIMREIRFYDIVVPEEGKANLLRDLKCFEGEFMFANRYGMREKCLNEILQKFSPFKMINMRDVKKTEGFSGNRVHKLGFFAGVYVLGELIDGHTKGKTAIEWI